MHTTTATATVANNGELCTLRFREHRVVAPVRAIEQMILSDEHLAIEQLALGAAATRQECREYIEFYLVLPEWERRGGQKNRFDRNVMALYCARDEEVTLED
jgi:hypothetical protein